MASEVDRVKLSGAAPPGPLDVVLVCAARNEAPRLPSFMDHYRSLGIKHFVFVDNGSTDDTADFLFEQPEVSLYSSAGQPYASRRKQEWLASAQQKYGHEGWWLAVDADEFVGYMGSTERTIDEVAAYAKNKGHTQARGLLVDLYPARPVLEYAEAPEPFEPLYFDTKGYDVKHGPAVHSVLGGPRSRAFRLEGREKPYVQLTKVPLAWGAPPDMFVHPHFTNPYSEGLDIDTTLGVAHHCFDTTTMRNVWAGLTTGKGRSYRETFEEEPDLNLMCDHSKRFYGYGDFVSTGLIRPWRVQ